MTRSAGLGTSGLTLGRGATALGAVAVLAVLGLGVASVGARLRGVNALPSVPVALVPTGLEEELAPSFSLGEVTRGGRAFALDDFRQVVAPDAIPPIYNPVLVPASAAPLDDEDLVLGVEINGESRAYPVGTLNGREMVNDEVGGVPILVSW